MAITLTSRKKSQKNLLLIFLVSLVIIFIILYYQFFYESEPLVVDSGQTEFIRKIKIDFGVLDSNLVFQLTPFSDFPATPTEGEMGRENPFYPYETSSSLK